MSTEVVKVYDTLGNLLKVGDKAVIPCNVSTSKNRLELIKITSISPNGNRVSYKEMYRIRADGSVVTNNDKWKGEPGDTFEVKANKPYQTKDSYVMVQKVVKVIGLKEKLMALA
jgi:hypothetical protein